MPVISSEVYASRAMKLRNIARSTGSVVQTTRTHRMSACGFLIVYQGHVAVDAAVGEHVPGLSFSLNVLRQEDAIPGCDRTTV
jgi:hypothetical protein